MLNYTIPRTIRELQPETKTGKRHRDYTIPRTIRELQLEIIAVAIVIAIFAVLPVNV